MEEKNYRQVVTEYDMFLAMYDYLAEQFDGRFRMEFPENEQLIDGFLENLNDAFLRSSQPAMKLVLLNTISLFGTQLTHHLLDGCHVDESHHEFMREVINTIWDSRELTTKWLHHKGIVPGRSVN